MIQKWHGRHAPDWFYNRRREADKTAECLREKGQLIVYGHHSTSIQTAEGKLVLTISETPVLSLGDTSWFGTNAGEMLAFLQDGLASGMFTLEDIQEAAFQDRLFRQVELTEEQLLELYPIYTALQPDTKVYRLVGEGYPLLPIGSGRSGFWSTCKKDIETLVERHIDACGEEGYLVGDLEILESLAKDFTPRPDLHFQKKENHDDDFDRHEVFLVPKEAKYENHR